MTNLKNDKYEFVESIERATYENFCEVKDELQSQANDTPLKRLISTKRETNSYTPNNESKFGSCIYLC